MKPSKLEAVVNRRVFFTRIGLGIGGIGLARIIAACSNNSAGKLGDGDIPSGPSTPKPTDGDEYVPGKSDPVVADEAPKIPNPSWEARVKQLEGISAIYTLAAPGPWAGKERSHIPEITIAGNKVTAVVQHVMGSNGLDAGYVDATVPVDAAKPDAGTDAGLDAALDASNDAGDAGDAGTVDAGPKPPTAIHYITTIYLKSQTGDVVGLYEFASTDAAPPTVIFTLPAGVTSVTPYEYCTIHGLWANDAKPVS
ncbi:MAG: hypothetical protein JWM74_2910 [Myxococcaceae bacterium]|nr:hypothetical protein [Myxococcaceae bacterium]